jgi:hypothetical protein
LKIRLFLLGICFSTCLLAQDTLTIREVFDYDVGDEFHRKRDMSQNGWNYDIYRYTITKRQVSATRDTIFYSRIGDNYKHDVLPPLVFTFWKDTVDFYVTDLDSSIFYYMSLSQPLDTFLKKYDTTLVVDTTLEFDNFFCNRLVNGVRLFSISDLDNDVKYGKGLGGVYSSYFEGFQSAPVVNNLFYYKKGSETCGTPDLFTGVEDQPSVLQVSIFPNPAKNFIKVSIPGHFKNNIEVYNELGSKMMLKDFTQEVIDISQLPPGMYFIRSGSGDTEIYYHGKFIKL